MRPERPSATRQRSVDLVGGNLQKFRPLAVEGSAGGRVAAVGEPCAPATFQQILCAEDVGLQEEARIGDGAVYVALGGEIDHIVGVFFAEYALHQRAVADIALNEGDIGALQLLLECEQIARIGEGVEHHYAHVVAMLPEQIFHEICADKSGSSCHEICCHTDTFNIFPKLRIIHNKTKSRAARVAAAMKIKAVCQCSGD